MVTGTSFHESVPLKGERESSSRKNKMGSEMTNLLRVVSSLDELGQITRFTIRVGLLGIIN